MWPYCQYTTLGMNNDIWIVPKDAYATIPIDNAYNSE